MSLASTQDGVLARGQLAEQGVSVAALSRARRRGLIVDMTARTVRIASAPDTFERRCRAVDLHVGVGGFLSGRTAGRLHGLRSMWTTPVTVTVAASQRLHLPAWAKVHQTRWFDAERDRVEHDSGIHIAEPHRMLWALAASLGQVAFERAAEDAWHLGLVSPTSAAEYLEAHRCRGKDGVARLERWLAKTVGQARPAQSELELRLLEALERAGAPTPQRQHPIRLPDGRTIHVDIAWPDAKLAVEPGHSWWHGGDRAMSIDLDRKLAAAELGWDTMQLDEIHLRTPDRAARRILRVLGRRSRLLAATPSRVIGGS